VSSFLTEHQHYRPFSAIHDNSSIAARSQS